MSLQIWRASLRRSLGRRLLLILGLVLWGTLALILACATYLLYRTEARGWQGRQDEAARNAAGTVAAVIHRARYTLEVVALIDASLLTTHHDDLRKLLEQNPTLEEVIRLDPAGHVLVGANRDRPVLADLITIPQSRWFLETRRGQAYLGPLQLAFDIRPYLLMAVPAPDGGVVAARVGMRDLWAAVADIRFGETGTAYVATRTGLIVAHTRPEVVLEGITLADQPEFAALLSGAGPGWSGAYVNFEALPVVGATAPVPGTDWTVIAELPQAEAFAASRQALLLLGGGSLAVLVVSLAITARYIDRLVIRPMAHVRAGAVRVGHGDLQHRIGLEQPDEIGQLAQAFDEMAGRLYNRDQQMAAQTAALQTSEARYRAIVEDQTELICRFQADGALTFVNEAYCRYFGRTREELIGRSFVPLIPEDDHALIEAHMARLTPETPVAIIEHRVILPDGNLRWQQWTDRLILDAQGQPVEFQAVGRDITERRLAEAEVRASEERLRRITDNMFDVISQVNMNGVIEYASPSHQWVLGFAPETVIGEAIYSRVHPEDLNAALQALADAIHTLEARKSVVIRYRHAAGHYLWMEAVGNLVFGPDGQVSHIILSSRDVTARQQIEHALRESERRHRLLADNATDVIWVRNLDLELTYVSPAVQKLQGVSVETALTQTLAETLHPDSVETGLRSLTEMVTLAQEVPAAALRFFSRTVELEALRQDGATVWTETQLSFLLDDHDRPIGILGVTRDIADRRRAADDLRQLNLALEGRVQERTAELVRVNANLITEVRERQSAEAQLRASLKEKEVMLKEIHHRVKNNLQIISSLLNLQSHAIHDPRTLEMLRDSQNRVKSMALVHEKLYRSIDLARIDFAEYTRSLTSQLLRTYAENTQAVALTLIVEDVWLDVDAAIPCGLIINELVSNALKHAFPDGREGGITVEVRRFPAGDHLLRVSDTGVGFPAGVDYEVGASLGLKLVHTLVDQLEGRITVESAGGAAVAIVFPAQPHSGELFDGASEAGLGAPTATPVQAQTPSLAQR